MKADKRRSEHQFKVGDWVYLKIQAYRQNSVVNRNNLKLTAKYFGPFEILSKVGLDSYKLMLLNSAKNTLSVPCLSIKTTC